MDKVYVGTGAGEERTKRLTAAMRAFRHEEGQGAGEKRVTVQGHARGYRMLASGTGS